MVAAGQESQRGAAEPRGRKVSHALASMRSEVAGSTPPPLTATQLMWRAASLGRAPRALHHSRLARSHPPRIRSTQPAHLGLCGVRCHSPCAYGSVLLAMQAGSGPPASSSAHGSYLPETWSYLPEIRRGEAVRTMGALQACTRGYMGRSALFRWHALGHGWPTRLAPPAHATGNPYSGCSEHPRFISVTWVRGS